MVRLITYMVATTAMILGIKALDSASEIQLQNSLEEANIIASPEFEDVALVEDSKDLKEDARGPLPRIPPPTRERFSGRPTHVGFRNTPPPPPPSSPSPARGGFSGLPALGGFRNTRPPPPPSLARGGLRSGAANVPHPPMLPPLAQAPRPKAPSSAAPSSAAPSSAAPSSAAPSSAAPSSDAPSSDAPSSAAASSDVPFSEPPAEDVFTEVVGSDDQLPDDEAVGEDAYAGANEIWEEVAENVWVPVAEPNN